MPKVNTPMAPIYAINKPFYDIMDSPYGVVGNGVADDTAAIQAAINASVSGATIFFPEGAYLISSPIILLGGRSYLGGSIEYGAPTILASPNFTGVAMFATAEYYNNQSFSGTPITVENLFFDGQSGATSGNNWTAQHNTGLHGLVFMNSYSLIRACSFHNVDGAGVLQSNATRNGTFCTNSIVENHIEVCRMQTVGAGIWVRESGANFGTDGYLRDNVIGQAYNLTLAGIQVERGGGWFLSGNHVYGAQGNGINVSTAWSTFIIGNEIDGYGQSSVANFYAGIGVSTTSPRATVIEGNIISVNAEVNDASHYQHLAITMNGVVDSRAIVTGNQIQGGYIATSSTTSLVSGAKTPCAPKSMIGITPGITLFVQNESVLVASITATTFTPTTNWAGNHGPSSYVVASSKSAGLSIGLVYQTGSSQQASGLPGTIIGMANRVDAVGQYNFADSFVVIGPVGVDGTIALTEPQRFAVPTLTNGSTIPVTGLGVSEVTTGGAVTGIILAPGTQGGQIVAVVNESANSITFAAAATSNVALGVGMVIAANSKQIFVWDSGVSRWF